MNGSHPIDAVAIMNHDPEVSPYMKVVMVENYNVSYAERLIPACDVSEQKRVINQSLFNNS
mgnify:CR=1 FL=1